VTTPVTLDQALAIARQLSPSDRARLVSQLVTELADLRESSETESSATNAWTRLESFWQSIEAPGPAVLSATEQLLEDRRARQETLEGSDHVHS
jgi:hypothetical protein